jgi:hypothetical protein
MAEPMSDGENPYAPPASVAGPVDAADAEAAHSAEAGLGRSRPWEILYDSQSLVDWITAGLLGLIITFVINPRAWISLGKVRFASFCVERYLFMPALAVLLMKIGRGLRAPTDRARRAQIGFSASFLILYVALKVFYARWNMFSYDYVVSWLFAWLVWILCAGAHVGSISLLRTSGARGLTTNRYRALPGPRPRAERWLLWPLVPVCTLAAIGTTFGISIISENLMYLIEEFVGD